MFRLDNENIKFDYAYDVTILATSSTQAKNSSILSFLLCKALDWGQAKGLTFDPAKPELQLFPRRRLDKGSRMIPPVKYGNITVTESATFPYTRWLGVYFKKTLPLNKRLRKTKNFTLNKLCKK